MNHPTFPGLSEPRDTPSPRYAPDYLTQTIGIVLLLTSLVLSFVLLPFLAPILQGLMLIAAIPGVLCGIVGGVRHRVWLAAACAAAVAIVYFVGNFNGPFGIRAAFEIHILGVPPPPGPGYMYFHSWSHGFHCIAAPLHFGAALLACEITAHWRARKQLPDPAICAGCGYNLTGNQSGRCPECGVTVADATTDRQIPTDTDGMQ